MVAAGTTSAADEVHPHAGLQAVRSGQSNKRHVGVHLQVEVGPGGTADLPAVAPPDLGAAEWHDLDADRSRPGRADAETPAPGRVQQPAEQRRRVEVRHGQQAGAPVANQAMVLERRMAVRPGLGRKGGKSSGISSFMPSHLEPG